MHPVLLELHAAKIVDVCSVTFHLLQHELDFRLRDQVLFIDANDARLLPELSCPTAPTRPDA